MTWPRRRSATPSRSPSTATALPADLEPLLVSAHVDDSLNLPDLSSSGSATRTAPSSPSRRSRSGRSWWSPRPAWRPRRPNRSSPRRSPRSRRSSTPPARSPSSAGSTPRTGSSAAGAPRPTRRSRPPTWRRRSPSGRGSRSARSTRRPRSSTTVSRPGVTDWEFLDGLAREVGHEVAVKDGKFEFRARAATDAPAQQSAQSEPAVLRQGTDLLRFRAVVTSAEQVKEVQVRGWDVAQQAGTGRHRAREDPLGPAVRPGVAPADLANTFGDPVYVATDVPFRAQSEVDARGEGARGADRRRIRRSSRASPGATPRSVQGPRSRSTTSARRSTASTW